MKHTSYPIPLLLASFALLAATEAHAGIEACGNIHVEAEAECTVEVDGGCEAQCTPLSVEAACAGELELECRGQCDVEAEASCSATCEVAECVAQCEIDPPSFECTAECNARADATCSGRCEASADRRECEASCKATYSAECDASCTRTPGSASCQARCEASCEAECRAEANVDCQIDCQSDLYVECKARIQGGCELACRRPEGALFCDGQYVDHGGNLDECVTALRALVPDVEVEASGRADGDCVGNRCEGSAEGSAKASCAVPVAPGSSSSTGWLGVALAVTSGALMRRRRRS